MKKQFAFALVGSMLCNNLFAIVLFERHSVSLLTISDMPIPVPQPVSVVSPALDGPRGTTDGFTGAPSSGGPNGEPVNAGDSDVGEPGSAGDSSSTGDGGGKPGDPGTQGVKEGVQKGEGADGGSDRGDRGTPGAKEGVQKNEVGDGAGSQGADASTDGKGAAGRPASPSSDQKLRDGADRERREYEREQENRSKSKDLKQKEDRNRDKKKRDPKGVSPDDKGKDRQDGPRLGRERSAFNLRGLKGFREIARLAEGGASSASDLPSKYVGRPTNVGDIPLPYWPIPSTTIGSPSAHGADWTDVFAGVGLQNRARFGTLPNSTAIVGFGLGNSVRNVGLEIGISSYGLIRHGLPFTTGGISFKLHHYFRDWQLGVAAGFENAIYWKSPDSGQSFYIVFSKYFLIGNGAKHEPFRTLFVHAGLGDGRFRPESSVRVGVNAISPFVALAMRAADPVNLILNWTGSDLAAGVSVTPFRVTPISLGFSALDILHQAGDGVRFSMVVSYGDSVVSPNFPVSWFRSNGSEIRAGR